MDEVMDLFYKNKLIVRAMDLPSFGKCDGKLYYDCSTWANEFSLMEQEKFTSVSSTLIIPKAPITLYKNVGYLVDSSLAECFHISKNDSGSSGNIADGDFSANEADFSSIDELAKYIISNHHYDMNEVNLNLDLTSVLGLVVSKCFRESILLKRMLIVRQALCDLTGITYPIYEYDAKTGSLSFIDLSIEKQEAIIASTKDNRFDNIMDYFYYTDDSEEIIRGEFSLETPKPKMKF